MSLGEASATDTLGELQGKGDKFTKLSLIEKKRMADLEDAIAYVMKESDKYREMAKKSAIEVMNIHVLTPNPAYQRADGVNIAKEAQIVTAKTLIVMEAKLNKLLSRQSEIQNSNKLMKETINHYRILRKQTDVSHASFEQRLREEKEKIEAYLGESTFILEERERNLKRKEEIEQKNIEEQQQFTQEYEEMGRYVKDQNDALELALLNERKADRASMQKTGRAAEAADENPNTANLSSDLTVDEELAMAKQVGSLNQFMIEEQNALSDLLKKIATYETMFEQLKKMTGVENLEAMVSGYIAHEEEMFSLYNFIQSMNAEIDVIVEQTARTEADINEFKKDQIDQDYLRKSTLDELQTRLSNMLDITQTADEQNSVHAESVMQISKKVSSLFFKLQCDQMDIKPQNSKGNHSRGSSGPRPESKIALLTGQGVSDGNVLEYLGCIEQRSVDIISDYLRVLTANKDPSLNVLRLQTIPRSPTPGPPTAASWQGNGTNNLMSQKINLEDLGTDDDGLFGVGDGGANAGESNNMPSNSNNKESKEKDADDNKVVDLNAFKNKLQKKLPLKPSTSGTKLGIR